MIMKIISDRNASIFTVGTVVMQIQIQVYMATEPFIPTFVINCNED